MAKKTASTDDVLRELRAFGLAYPGTHTKSPWPGHLDLAVKDKTFAYLSLEGEPLHVSCKLDRSAHIALMLPFVKPAAYGLGKSGWVAADFTDHAPDVDMLKSWIDESYRAQAPKKLLAQAPPPPSPMEASARPKTAHPERSPEHRDGRSRRVPPKRAAAPAKAAAPTKKPAAAKKATAKPAARAKRG